MMRVLILKRMDEQDALDAMRDLASALKCFRDQHQHHQDVQPSNVFVLDTKQLKLVDVVLLNGERSGFDRKFQEFDYNSPLCPQALVQLQNSFVKSGNSSSKGYDKEKNDVWSLGTFSTVFLTTKGITMLAILMNEDYNKYYDWKSNLILFDVIRSRINSLSQKLKYSSNLVTLISGCLEKNEDQRSSISQIYSRLLNLTEGRKEANSPAKSELRRSTIHNDELYSMFNRSERQSEISQFSQEDSPISMNKQWEIPNLSNKANLGLQNQMIRKQQLNHGELRSEYMPSSWLQN